MKRVRFHLSTTILLIAACMWSSVDARAQAGGTIQGTVSAAEMELIPTVMITAVQADSTVSGAGSGLGATYVAVPEPEGMYRIDGVEPGSYVVYTRSPEFSLVVYDGAATFSDATLVVVADGVVADSIDFEMRRIGTGSGAIEGTVTDAETGAPIESASVTAMSREGAWFKAATDATGLYRISGVATGEYLLEARGRGYASQFFDLAEAPHLATPVSVSEPDTTRDINFVLTPAGSISGVVRDASGEPFEGVFLSAVPFDSDSLTVWSDSSWSSGGILGGPGTPPGGLLSGSGEYGTRSGPDGRYILDGIPGGTYRVQADVFTPFSSATVWYDGAVSWEAATPVEVTAGADRGDVNFDMPVSSGFGMIAGRVTDEAGQGLDHVTLLAYPAADSITRQDCCPVAFARTLPDGHYEMSQVPAGELKILAIAETGWSVVERWYVNATSWADATVVSVGKDGLTPGIDLVLPVSQSAGSISGHVLDSAGSPLGQARVWVESVDSRGGGGSTGSGGRPVNGFAESDSSGAYSVSGLPAGSYTVMAAAWDGDRYGQVWFEGAHSKDEATPVTVGEDEAVTAVDLLVDMAYLYGDVGGTVIDAATGLPIERAFVQAYPASASGQFAPILSTHSFAVTDREGRFVIEQLPVGTYQLSAHVESGFAYVGGAYVAELGQPIDVVGGALADASIVVERTEEGTASIEGMVTIDYSVPWADSVQAPYIAIIEARPTATIALWPDSERFYATVVRTDGSYSLDGMPAGEYVVSAFSPGFAPEYFDDVFDPAAATFVLTTDGAATTGIDFAMVPSMLMDASGGSRAGGTALHGRVADSSGEPVAGATVYLMDTDGNAIASTTSAADGTYAFPSVDRGEYRIMVVMPGFETGYGGGSEYVSADGSAVEVNVVLSPGTATDVEDEDELPAGFRLDGNYPNPFNPTTTIRIELPEAATVGVDVFDVLGRLVLSVGETAFGAGPATLHVDASALQSGVYLFRVTSRSQGRLDARYGTMTLLR